MNGENMKQPEISVVVPVYNTSPYLEQCISSIINQTFQDIEIICVDDGSTDNSLDILRRLASQDTRMSVIHREKASGSAAVPRNIGIDHASGKYIIFLDSDDYFDLRMFEKMYNCAEEKKADLVMCDNYYVSFIDGKIQECEGELCLKYIKKNDVFSYKDIPDRIFQISNSVWNKLILRNTVVKSNLKFQENTCSLDDVYFVNLLLVFSKRIYILDERFVYYRQLRFGGQTTKVARYKESIFAAFDKLNKYLINSGLYHEVKKSLQNWILATLVWWYYLVKEQKVEQELFYLYKNCYFEKLGLMDMKDIDIYQNKDFYDYVLYEDYKPSVSVILNTISPKGTKVVLYGAGKLGKNTYKFIIRNEPLHTIKLWCDKNVDNLNNPFIEKPEKIKEIEYDAVLIAIGDELTVLEVKDYLKRLGVDKEKIYTV